MKQLLEALPEILETHHLIEIGLYNSIDAAYSARVRGKSPDYIQIGRKVLYTKQAIIKFLEANTYSGSIKSKELED